MNIKIAPLLILSLGLAGCGLYVVKKSTPAGEHHGIPFYVKTAGCKREIIRLKPYYLLTLTTKTGEKTSESESAAICRDKAMSPDVQTLLDDARQGNPITASWTAVKKLACDPLDQPAEGSPNWLVTSDTRAAYTYVDYQNPYTLNVRRPIMGSASATTKLAEDGTLSEGTAQVEDKTVATVLGMIPSADLIKAAAGVKGFVAVSAPYELKIEQKGVKFTWTYHDPATHEACEKDDNLNDGSLADSKKIGKPDLVIEDAGGEKKAADDNTVKVNGSIQLPKAKGSGPAANK